MFSTIALFAETTQPMFANDCFFRTGRTVEGMLKLATLSLGTEAAKEEFADTLGLERCERGGSF
jgi:hypothetical protein